MLAIVKSAKFDCCRKLEIMFPTLSKDALDQIVTFLYNGQILCNNQNDGTRALKNLTTLLGFPESMNFSQSIKDESYNEDIQMFDVPKREPNYLNDSIGVHIDQGIFMFCSYSSNFHTLLTNFELPKSQIPWVSDCLKYYFFDKTTFVSIKEYWIWDSKFTNL